MENASKAILITGAILIVIIIVSIMWIILGKAGGIADIYKDNITEEDIISHNALFNMYDGEITGTELISLLLKAEAYNEKSDIDVNVTSPGFDLFNLDAGSIITYHIEKDRIYNVAAIEYNEQGAIILISIF